MIARDIGPAIIVLGFAVFGLMLFLRKRREEALQRDISKRHAELKAQGDQIRELTSSNLPTATEDLARRIEGVRALSLYGEDLTPTINKLVANNVLRQELGEFADKPSCYDLEQRTRDILLAHGRQDAAHALSNTISLMTEISRLHQQLHRRINRLEGWLVFLFLLTVTAEQESLRNVLDRWFEWLGLK